MISNIQFLRAFAAIAVVFYHTAFVALGVHTEFSGVPLFFAISGFIMTLISREETKGFFVNRLTRIVPLYWIMTIAFYLLARGFHPDELRGLAAPDEIIGLVKSLFFIPYRDFHGTVQPVNGVGWTLNLEMYFYALFAISLLISTRFSPLFTAAVVIGVWAIVNAIPAPPEIKFYGDSDVLFFVFGIVVYYLWSAVPAEFAERYRLILAGVGLVVVAAYLALPFAKSWAFAEIGPPVLLLTAAILHKANVRLKNGTVLLLGGASYSIYLGQFFILAPLQRVTARWPFIDPSSNVWVAIAATVVCVVFGIGLYLVIERPALRLFRMRRRSREATAVAPLA